MRRLLFLIVSVLVSLLYPACNIIYTDSFSEALSIENEIGAELTKSNDNHYKITEKDIESYIEFKRILKKKESLDGIVVEPFPENDNPIAYVVQFPNCWELLSSDKRTPPVLAEGPGVFKEDENPAALFWMKDLCRAVAALSSTDELSSFHKDNVLFWKLINGDENIIENHLDDTRSLTLPFHPGYFIESIDSTFISETIPHYLSTHWGQESPYNLYCPDKFLDSGKAPAGCVAIAGAQMLYYLHFRFFIPDQAPDSAFCSGHSYYNFDNYAYYVLNHLPSPYQMSQGSFSSSAWTDMASGNSYTIAALVANIGKEAGLTYCNNETFGFISDLPSNVFSPIYGISSEYCSYDEDVILYKLEEDALPSIVRAEDSDYNGSGHAFIIDRYSYNQVRYCFTFRKRDDPSIMIKDVIYTTPVYTQFGMNWGWNGVGDDYMFAVQGDWNPSIYNFTANKAMVVFER